MSTPRFSSSATARSLSAGLVARGHDVRQAGLRLVGPVRVRAKKAPFVVVVLSVLVVGLVGLILMSTAMQAQSFRISELNREAASLEAERSMLTTEVEALSSPAAVARKALAQGMVPNSSPVFLRLSDGAVIGTPTPAEPDTNVKRAE